MAHCLTATSSVRDSGGGSMLGLHGEGGGQSSFTASLSSPLPPLVRSATTPAGGAVGDSYDFANSVDPFGVPQSLDGMGQVGGGGNTRVGNAVGAMSTAHGTVQSWDWASGAGTASGPAPVTGVAAMPRTSVSSRSVSRSGSRSSGDDAKSAVSLTDSPPSLPVSPSFGLSAVGHTSSAASSSTSAPASFANGQNFAFFSSSSGPRMTGYPSDLVSQHHNPSSLSNLGRGTQAPGKAEGMDTGGVGFDLAWYGQQQGPAGT